MCRCARFDSTRRRPPSPTRVPRQCHAREASVLVAVVVVTNLKFGCRTGPSRGNTATTQPHCPHPTQQHTAAETRGSTTPSRRSVRRGSRWEMPRSGRRCGRWRCGRPIVARYRYVYARGRDDGREEATSPGMGSFGFESAGVLTRPLGAPRRGRAVLRDSIRYRKVGILSLTLSRRARRHRPPSERRRRTGTQRAAPPDPSRWCASTHVLSPREKRRGRRRMPNDDPSRPGAPPASPVRRSRRGCRRSSW